MNPAMKELLEKYVLTDGEMGRFYLVRWVDIRAGVPIGKELAGETITTTGCSGRIRSKEYKAYRQVFVTLDDAQRVYTDKVRLAQTACSALAMFQESVFFANADYPECRWQKYKLGRLVPGELATRRELWTRLRNSAAESLAIWGAFKAVAEWLNIPGVAATLIDDEPLRKEVRRLNRFAVSAKGKLDKLGLSDKAAEQAAEVFEPCYAFKSQPKAKDIYAAWWKFALDETFGERFEEALYNLNPYWEGPLKGRGYDGKRV